MQDSYCSKKILDTQLKHRQQNGKGAMRLQPPSPLARGQSPPKALGNVIKNKADYKNNPCVATTPDRIYHSESLLYFKFTKWSGAY